MNSVHAKLLPREWRDVRRVLDRFDVHNVKATIFGGCLRDLMLGIAPKDIDVMVSTYELNILRIFGPNAVTFARGYGADDSLDFGKILPDLFFRRGLGKICFVHKYRVDWLAMPIDLICVDRDLTSSAIAAAGDFGICQIATDGRDLFWTDAFAADMANKKIILRQQEGIDPDREEKRAIYFAQKFAGLGFTRG